MEDFIISCDKNENDDSAPDDKSDSLVNTLTNYFNAEIGLKGEYSSLDEDFDLSNSEIPTLKKKSDIYLVENQENEIPTKKLHQSKIIKKHGHQSSQSGKYSNLRALYEPATEKYQDASRLLRSKINDEEDDIYYESATEKYQDVSRLLRSKINEEEDDVYNYNPDDDYDHTEDRKTVMVGTDYQAQVPRGLCHYDDALPYENEDKLIWDPNVIDNLAVEDYLKKAAEVSKPMIPMGIHLRDNEQALYLLQQCGHNVEEALRRLRMNVTLYNDNMSPWSEEECRNFEAGVRTFGKNFYLTQQNKVRTRSVGELVQFYYLWKKTERHDVFTHKVRLEKKKYTLHPGVTDFMDRFLEDQDVRDRSASPSVQCGIADEKQLVQNPPLKFKITK